MSDECGHCGSSRVTLFRDGSWFCRRNCYAEWTASFSVRVWSLARKLIPDEVPMVIEADDALARLEAWAARRRKPREAAKP